MLKYTVTKAHPWTHSGAVFKKQGSVLFQHWAMQPADNNFLYSLLACEWSCGDHTWQAVRNWTGSSGKQGSTTHLPLSAHSEHAHYNADRQEIQRTSPLFTRHVSKYISFPDDPICLLRQKEWQAWLTWSSCKLAYISYGLFLFQ